MADIERGRPPQRRDLAARMRTVGAAAGIIPGDPLAPVLEVLADIPDEVDLRIAPALARIEQAIAQIEAVKNAPPRPLSQTALNAAVATAIVDHLPRFFRTIHFAALVALLALVMAAAGGGYWWRDTHAGPNVTEVTNCRPAPQLDGGQAVACTFWIHPPTPGQH